MAEKGGGDSEMGANPDSMQKLLAKKAVFVDKETFAKASLISEQARTIKVLEHGREFFWGALAGGFGEGMMHPIDTLKTRMQSQAVISGTHAQKNILQMVRNVWVSDGLRGFYRGITPGVTGSLATGATYFGVIESTKKWLDEVNPRLSGHWSHFIAGAIGDTLGSFVYVPCEVMKQRMQVQGTRKSWASTIMKENISQKPGERMYGYYNGMFQAGHSIWKQHGLKGLYVGYWSTLARDVPFAGLMVTFYEALKDFTEYGKQSFLPNSNLHVGSSFEGLVLGGLAGVVLQDLVHTLQLLWM
ncbi:mitochondrial magnesium exporter 1-like isoform X5 [Musa acuminata AAA Group]|uniref:mitochondrial magnesium exporter 1-like isoform X5 n=1 Tax=Musa acuminata AAA Group TaxID=214697 RepID=UPI0031DAE8C7